MIRGGLEPLGGAIDNERVREAFLDEFRKRVKFGGKELRHDARRVGTSSRGT
jgi:hypothetical protein